jgi:tetratricopeptide (TPR) repeat protein
MRRHEFEADRIAADAVGGELLGRALCRSTVADAYLDAHYWPSLFARTRDEPDPPTTAISGLVGVLAAAASGEEAASWIARELARETHELESHPSLAERLDALGVEPSVLEPAAAPSESAAHVLGSARAAVEEELNIRWQQEVAQLWQLEHERVIEARLELAGLEGIEQLTVGSLLRRADLTAELRDAEEALERYREVLASDPSNAAAHFAVGRLLLERGDVSGIEELEQAMDADPDAILPACFIAAAFLDEAGRSEEADRFRERAAARIELLEASAGARKSYSAGDEIGAVTLRGRTNDLTS